MTAQEKTWDQIRRSVYQRDNYTCRICSTRGGMVHAHHIVPKRAEGKDEPDNLLTVCGVCHAREHGHIAATFWLFVACLWKLGVQFGNLDENGILSSDARSLEGLHFMFQDTKIDIAGLKATVLLPVEYLDENNNVISRLPEGFLDSLIRIWRTYGVEKW